MEKNTIILKSVGELKCNIKSEGLQKGITCGADDGVIRAGLFDDGGSCLG